MKSTVRSQFGGHVVVQRDKGADFITMTVVSAAGNTATIAMGPHVAACVLQALGIEADAALDVLQGVAVEIENLGPATAGAAAGTAHTH